MAWCLLLLAFWILLSGLDDLFICLVFLWNHRKPFPWPSDETLAATPERRIAILVPLWREHRVIGQMLERNLSILNYSAYEIFVGIYPNDELTARAVADIAARHDNIHIARVGHDGPTSKGDCLNWIYHRMQRYEVWHGRPFEVVMTHDAEDLLHPDSLRLINWFSRSYDMVQIPVLPLATGADWTHGIYCDEFAEFQSKDIPVRQKLGGFLPSNGVGAAFGRTALDRVASTRDGRVFDPESLTEDYENGYQMHALGYRQIFIPIRFDSAGPIATREYFPRTFWSAVRQRSRWIAGVSLQGWERHGWRVPWPQVYWFWRDRKGLMGNLISPVANLLFLYGLALSPALPWAPWICAGTLALSAVQVAVRMQCAGRIYGWRFAALVPLRVLWGNVVNCVATAGALSQFAAARLARRSLAWRKTEHAYPQPSDVLHVRPRLGELLVSRQCLPEGDLRAALQNQPKGLRLGEYLIHLQQLSEENLYRALSSQGGIPLGSPAPGEVNPQATRSLPGGTVRRWKVMPYRVVIGQLHVLTSDIPSRKMTRELASFSRLEIRFRLVRPAEMEKLARRYSLLI